MIPISEQESVARDILGAVKSAEDSILNSIGRECDALRSGRLLAARAIRTRLCDCARMYIAAIGAARSAIRLHGHHYPKLAQDLEKRREAFAALLRVEIAALAAARAHADAIANAPPLAISA